jgi:CheY-like chemotaxis protein
MPWLIAEDEADIRNLIAMMCQIWGHETLLFENGERVWNWLDEVETGGYQGVMPELVLMDIRMPGKKGTEIAQRMRAIPHFQPLPIVLMTAFSLNESERSEILIGDGVDHIINKPLPDLEELRHLLHNILERKRTA